jgi:hypothetical protein
MGGAPCTKSTKTKNQTKKAKIKEKTGQKAFLKLKTLRSLRKSNVK